MEETNYRIPWNSLQEMLNLLDEPEKVVPFVGTDSLLAVDLA